ncbi:retrovirus-related pol polyprotein from transposon TNT 1-94 [Tanacetum coccineum]|uniref:Retrovirus-related pol polyprotein from transposon TNT 1-94 n=1 Tax=Tanacetum coccineum TaxID=301880 RepID=A0ABQ5IHP9_9ASTR
MACATSTKSWLWHQCLSHFNFDTINDLAKNDLVTGLPKFKYHKDHLCPSCEQGKSKKASHPPKPVPNSKQDKALEEIKTFLKKIIVLLQALVIIVRTDNVTEFKNQVLQEYFNSVGISHQASFVITPQQNGVAEAIATVCYTQNRFIIHCRFNKTPYELINGRKPDISFRHVFEALCYPKNDREDIGKLGAKVQTRSSKHDFWTNQFRTQSYLMQLPTIQTSKKPTECELDLLFEAMYDDYIGGQPSSATITASAVPTIQVLHTPTASSTTADTAPTNLSSQATNIPNTSQDVDELEPQQQHVQQQDKSNSTLTRNSC